jgi:hypothetical protein
VYLSRLSVLEMDREDAARGGLQGDLAEVGGEGGEEFLRELVRWY